MNLEQLRKVENLSVRAYNVCVVSKLGSLELIIDWYKKHGKFSNIRNCGNNTNQELETVCLKYLNLDNSRFADSSVRFELSDLLSTRAYNLCLYNGLNNLDSLIDFYKLNGSFDKFRNCGLKTNLELINFCKDHVTSFSINKEFDVKVPGLFLVENFNRTQLRVIRYYYYLLFRNLPLQARRALRDYLGGRSFYLESIFEKILNNPAFDLGYFHFLGIDEIRKLSHFIECYKNTVQIVSGINSAKELVNLNYRLTLGALFPYSELYYKLRGNSIFCAVQVVIENDILFGKNVLNIFLNRFNIYNSQINLSNTNSSLSRERIRQICKSIKEDLYDNLRFVNMLIDESLDNHVLIPESDIIYIDNVLNERINELNHTDFTKEWNSYLIYLYFSRSYTLVGQIEDVLFRKNYKNSGRHNWNYFYIINSELSELFDFVLLIDDFSNLIESDRLNDDCFSLSLYIGEKLGISNSEYGFRILELASFLISHEFGIESDGYGNYLLENNTVLPLHQYAYNALSVIGSQASVAEITKKVNEMFPKVSISEMKIRRVLKRSFGFVPVGRSSIFGLAHWENEFSSFKGGTIRSLVSDYLKMEGSPRHINAITDFVKEYRPDTYNRSVWQNLRTDTSGVFVFSNDGFVGLKSDVSDESFGLFTDYLPEKVKTWEESYSEWVNFVAEHRRLPKSSGCPLTEIQIYRWSSIQIRRIERGELDLSKSNLIKNVVDEFSTRSPRKRLSISKNIENFESIIFDILNECPGQTASKEFLHTELVKISKLDGQLINKILNKAPFLKRRLCLTGRPFYYYHTTSDILDISREYDNIQDFILFNLEKADYRLEFYYNIMRKMIAVPNPEVVTGGISRLIYLKEVTQFYHKFINDETEILISNRTRLILDNLIMGICESMANRRDISFFMDMDVYNNQFVNDFVSYLVHCGVVRLNMNEIKIEIVYLISYNGDKVILENNTEALFLPFVLKDYFIAHKLKCEFMVLGFNVKYNNMFNLISYERKN